MPVKDGESEEGSVAVGGEGRLGQGRQVVHVEEAGAVCVVVARQQQVHVIRSLAGKEEGEREKTNTGGLTFRCGVKLLLLLQLCGMYTITVGILKISQSRPFTSGKRFGDCGAGGCWLEGCWEKERKNKHSRKKTNKVLQK